MQRQLKIHIALLYSSAQFKTLSTVHHCGHKNIKNTGGYVDTNAMT